MRRLRGALLRLGGLASHLQMHIDDNLHAGMSPQEARRNALLKLGGM